MYIKDLCPLLFAVITISLIPACSSESQRANQNLAPPSESGVLHVATRNGSTTYYLDRHENPAGPEYALITDYAAARGWEVEWTMYDSTAEVVKALDSSSAHLAAAGLTLNTLRNAKYAKGPAHTEVSEQLVCHRELRPLPDSYADLSDFEIVVTEDSSYVDTLKDINADYADINFREDSRTSELILTAVAEKDIPCSVADANIVNIMQRHFPYLEVAMDLTDGRNLGWYSPNKFRAIADDAHEWMNSDEGNDAIGRMESRYYSYIREFDFVDLRALNRSIEKRLKHYIDDFETAEENTGMPADLLAALAYQESNWNPKAVSPTGVRGIMMLTQATAEQLGVEDRTDPEEAIDGGARYLADRHQRLPESIPEPDRTYLALASYNIGRGHLLDARQLARDLGKNPDSWSDMREVLPLKADKRYYPSTRYGYARGYEPVHYVQRIRNYRDVIKPVFSD
ncbi:MAG: membrane-bound lytic murein transglycosylase MltF [Methylophaga sp.]|uniref:membrane-bound lytic murein transglycosylase MltF n=1 Tax=Methylophaga sp. TaxID=2024840 RepID=UPI00299DED3C|nr:membrane-bound lytic murein transglycosylase MltF [Methylophaga sp.]MDX1748688.1 membrane-bound lytic murein transglycosylase MltF [Methylophaga sp.]